MLYVNEEDDLVHKQTVALSGACGLNTDDEIIEHLSPWVLRGITFAENRRLSGSIELVIIANDKESDAPLIVINGEVLRDIAAKPEFQPKNGSAV